MSEQTTAYQQALALVTRMSAQERLELVEYIIAAFKENLSSGDVVGVFQAMPWDEFVERTAGSLADDPIERPPQPPLEEREPFE